MRTLGPEDSSGFDEGEAQSRLYNYENECALPLESYDLGVKRSLARRVADSCYGIDKEELLWIGASAVSAVAIVGLVEGQDDIRNFVEQSLGYLREVLIPFKNWNLPR